jgi:hypothetical protein
MRRLAKSGVTLFAIGVMTRSMVVFMVYYTTVGNLNHNAQRLPFSPSPRLFVSHSPCLPIALSPVPKVSRARPEIPRRLGTLNNGFDVLLDAPLTSLALAFTASETEARSFEQRETIRSCSQSSTRRSQDRVWASKRPATDAGRTGRRLMAAGDIRRLHSGV